jgi:hypothetical protein
MTHSSELLDANLDGYHDYTMQTFVRIADAPVDARSSIEKEVLAIPANNQYRTRIAQRVIAFVSVRMEQRPKSQQGPLLLVNRDIVFRGRRKILDEWNAILARNEAVLPPEPIERVDPSVRSIPAVVRKLGDHEIPWADILNSTWGPTRHLALRMSREQPA